MCSYIPLGLNQLLNVGVGQWFHICIVDICEWVYILIEGLLLVGPIFHFRQCHSGLVPSRNEHMCPCHSMTRAGSWYGKYKGSWCLHPQLPANRTLSQSRLLHHDGLGPCVGNSSVPDCRLSYKDGAVVWQSFGQLAAGCLTILEMAVDDRRFPHSLVHFGAISVDFIMWSLCFTILIKLRLGFLSHALCAGVETYRELRNCRSRTTSLQKA